jgi:hypothetical protein
MARDGMAFDEFSHSTVGKTWPFLFVHKLRALATRRPNPWPVLENRKTTNLEVFALVSLERRRSIAEVAGVTALGNLSIEGARHIFPFEGKADGGWHVVTLEPPQWPSASKIYVLSILNRQVAVQHENFTTSCHRQPAVCSEIG